jgi:hypothetical protein
VDDLEGARIGVIDANLFRREPVFTRRTLDWLSTSLLKGMSREALNVIFWTEAISILRDGRPGAFLSTSNPSRTDRPLSHSPGLGLARPGMLKTSAPAAR